MVALLPTRQPPNQASGQAKKATTARRKGIVVGALVAAAAYSWFASGIDVRRFSPAAVALPVVIAAVAAFRSWMHHDRSRVTGPSGTKRRFGGLHGRAVLLWSFLAAVLIAWELRELTSSPRVDYPTVTSIVGMATSVRPVWALAFLTWLVLGYRLIERAK
jgi:hypothetical protein